MKKLLSFLTLIAVAVTMMAVPAKRGLWKTLTLADGTQVRATLVGDEHGHYWLAADGTAYQEVADADYYQTVDVQQVVAKAQARRQTLQNKRAQRVSRRTAIGERQQHLTGQKKGLVVLMEFTDTKFKTANNLAKYKDVLNTENYNVGSFKGSVSDYFKAQSITADGVSQFELTFDVVGPYTANKNYAYYGKDSGGEGYDQHPDELIVEAVTAAHNDADAALNFQDYDWDNDGEVDQVFIVYAGKGQANGGSSSTIWPHMYYLSETNKAQTIDGVKVNTYACSSELNASGAIDGIGTFCHEFSHCMGFPDFYDTAYKGWYGTGDYDLMCGGSYNGNGYQPAGYNAYEKWMAGWMEPIELTTDMKVENLKALSEGGDAYIIRNSGHPDEYYTIENRQKKGWDASLPGKGLMVIHVDFDLQLWQENNPNTKVTTNMYGYKKNDHQRFALVCADNSASDYTPSNDLYPYKTNNSLTATSTPKASLYNTNAESTKLLEKGITEIIQNADGTMSFVFGNPIDNPDNPDPDNPDNPDPDNPDNPDPDNPDNPDPDNPDNPDPDNPDNPDPDNPDNPDPDDPSVVDPEQPDGTLIAETFDNFNGTGGNDDLWRGVIAIQRIDDFAEIGLPGWYSDNAFKGYQCVKVGTSSVNGSITSPAFAVDGTATLKFRAGAWNAKGDGTTLELYVDNGMITPDMVTMTRGAFSDFEATITATGDVAITFKAEDGRFFLDDVVVTLSSETTGIVEMSDGRSKMEDGSAGWYSLDGRRIANGQQPTAKGIYIHGNKKVVIK